MTSLGSERFFPCPLCKEALDVRMSKKQKPYVVCDSCGLQLFVRRPAGIKAFNELVEVYGADDLDRELAYLAERYGEHGESEED